MTEPGFAGPGGRPVATRHGPILSEAQAWAEYIAVRARIRYDAEMRGGARSADRLDERTLREALAAAWGVTVYAVQMSARREVHAAYEALVAEAVGRPMLG